MLRDLQRLFRESVAAFMAELGRREPEDELAELLGAMRREMVDARAAIAEQRDALEKTQAELERERAELSRCERRREAAERIGDTETAAVASQFADRHRQRAAMLEKKLRVAEEELAIRTAESQEMSRRYQEADRNRFALLAQLRRARARGGLDAALGDAEGPFAEFARMEEVVEEGGRRADAMEELSEPSPEVPEPPGGVEERLREMKRKLGRE